MQTYCLLRKLFIFCLLLIANNASATEGSTPVSTNTFVQRTEVKEFIKQMVKKYEFQENALIDLFKHVKIRPKIIQKFKYPLEQKPWYTYKLLYVTDQRIVKGIAFWNKYQDALAKAEKIFGIPASIIVATIGIESKYGESVGEYPVIEALTNLAFEQTSRSAFFRKELEEFLLLTREQQLNPLKVVGSYAGAIGQPQFMPSSYRKYAVNFSGNQKIDLSHNEEDVIGSIANYYQKNGWLPNQPVAIPISMHGGKFQYHFTNSHKICLFELIENKCIPDISFLKDKKYNLISLQESYGNEYWFGYNNFEVIKRYNRSNLYAMAVFHLSYFISIQRKNFASVHTSSATKQAVL